MDSVLDGGIDKFIRAFRKENKEYINSTTSYIYIILLVVAVEGVSNYK